MASRSMALDVLVRLRDNLSGPLRRLQGNLKSLAGFARKIGLLGTAIAAISFMGPVREAGAFQQKLLDIAGTAELSGKAAFKFVDQAKAQYEDLSLKIAQTSDIIASGSGQMIAAGVNRDLIDATIGDIGRAATAANAEFSDMASVATSMLNNLKLPADQMKDSLGALVTAGKEGSFELKDMSKYFPQLTSQAAKFGVKGREAVNFLASSLQIAMKGASDPSIAANNFNNFLSKALSPRTVKNFANMGVNIQAVMQDAASKGINPLEAMLQKVGKLTGVGEKEIGKYMQAAKKNGLEGADALAYVRQQLEAIGSAGKVSDLFSDQQVLDFIVPFMANVQEYKDIKSKVAAATGAAIDADFETQMQGINRQITIFQEIGTQSIRQVGFAFAEWLPLINEWLIAGLTWMREFDASTGGWMKTLMTGAGGVVLLVAAIGALGLVLPIVGAGLSAIAALIGLIFSPIGVIIGLLAGAAYLVWKNWDAVAPYLSGMWEGIKDGASAAWDGIKSTWKGVQPYLERGWNQLKRMGGQLWSGLKDGGSRAWREIKSTWTQVQPYLERGWERLKVIGSKLWSGFSAQAKQAMDGINWDKIVPVALDHAMQGVKTLWDGYKAIGEGLAPSLDIMGKNLEDAFSSFGEAWQNFERLASALGQLIGFGETAGPKLQEFGKMLGQFLGTLGEIGTQNIKFFAEGISQIIKALADLAEWAAGGEPPDWIKWFPETATAAINAIATGVEKLWNIIKLPIQIPVLAWEMLAAGFEIVYNKIVGWLTALTDKIRGVASAIREFAKSQAAQPGDTLPNGGTFDDSRESVQEDYLKGTPVFRPANNNASEKHSSLEPVRGGQKFAALSSSQNVNVGGDIRIKVDGPGTVTSATSNNSKVAMSTDRGRTIGAA